jgi:mRNA-degrading endonuclease toxin of MazEF toxin-antitoxin module
VNEFPRRGFFYWVEIPAEPGRKRRPALVISINARNQFADDVLVVPASTTLRPAPTHVRLRKGTGGLPHESVLKCEQITTLPKRFLSSSALGREIPAALLEDVQTGILRAIGTPA